MTSRTVSIVFLFFAALATAGLGLALALALAARAGASPGPWIVPAIMFASFVGVFFLAREVVLPPPVSWSAGKALLALGVWMGATFALAAAITAVVGPLMVARGFGRGTVPILLACMIASVTILDRVAARSSRRRP